MDEVLKSSEEWSKEVEFTILDPAGWDRAFFEKSWNEKITKAEFLHRAFQSTISGLWEPEK